MVSLGIMWGALGMIRGVLFDFGGVITHTCWDTRMMGEILAKTLNDFGYGIGVDLVDIFEKVMEEAWNRVVHTLMEEKMEDLVRITLESVGINPDEDLIRTAIDRISEAPFCVIREDAEDALRRIKEMGIKTAVVSNSPINFHRRILKRVGIDKYIDEIIVSCDVGYRKPHPKIYEIAVDKLNIRPQQAVFVGDVLQIDIYGAKKLGMICILMESPEPYMRSRYVPNYGDVKPDFVVKNLREVVRIVKYLNNITKNCEDIQ